MAVGDKIGLRILSAEKLVYQGDVLQVSLPGGSGNFTVLPHHAPLISSLKEGVIKFAQIDDSVVTIEIFGGFVEINNGEITASIIVKNSGDE